MRVQDIVEAIEAIALEESVMNSTSEDVLRDVCLDAISYRVFTIGEAVKTLSQELKDDYPDVPWSNIARMRDLIGHHYYRRESEIVFATIRDPLAHLRGACERLAAVAPAHIDTT